MSQNRIWVTWPTADLKKSDETARRWMARGYFVDIQVNIPRPPMGLEIPGWKPPKITSVSALPPTYVPWNGYYPTVNVAAYVLVMRYAADVVIAATDGTLPDPRYTADQLAGQFFGRFPNSFGVMQPTGDVWQPKLTGKSAQEEMDAFPRQMHATPQSDERCESPWLGRRFILNMNRGRAPFCPKYVHYFADVELHDVASKLGILWKRPDLVQERIHWSRMGGPTIAPYQESNFDRWYEQDLSMLKSRRALQYPDSQPEEAPLIVNPKKRIIT